VGDHELTREGVAGSTADVVIRRADADEWRLVRAGRLRSLAEDPLSFGTTHAEAAVHDDDYWIAYTREHASSPDRALFVASTQSGIVGIVRAVRDPDEETLFGIYSFWVAPEARGRRIGTRLLEAAEAWAQARGAKRLELAVSDVSAAARRVYERAGYAYDGSTYASRHEGVTELGMTKAL
jgi:ribosomal protein S18 acetylase RimI-like enzyme